VSIVSIIDWPLRMMNDQHKRPRSGSNVFSLCPLVSLTAEDRVALVSDWQGSFPWLAEDKIKKGRGSVDLVLQLTIIAMAMLI